MIIRNVILSTLVTLFLGTQVAAQSVIARTEQEQLSRTVTLNMTNVTISQVLDEISKQSGIAVNIGERVIGASQKVSVDVANVSALEAVRHVIRGMDLTVRQAGVDRLVVVRMEQGRRNVGQGVIVGKVTDAKTGKGIAGANVSVDNNINTVGTDEDGAFRIAGVSVGNHTITVRLVGYAKQGKSIDIGDGTVVTVDFKLESSANVLDQVVVTGTVIASELRSVPNAITVITAKQIEERGISRIDQLFRGDIPGLFSLNMGSGTQLNEVTMFSRGATGFGSTSSGTSNGTNPIKTYIDGVEMADAKYLSQIDPASIERIEILTGPQASTVYGSNAINGVMQIFTKRGTVSRPQLTLGVSSGFTQNNFSEHLAPGHNLDAMVSGTEGRVSYSAGSSWNYAGSWTPANQIRRLDANGAVRIGFGKITADMSARQGITRNAVRGSGSQNSNDLSITGLYQPSAWNGLPFPQNWSLNGRTVGLTVNYNPASWWSHELVIGSDAAATETIRISPWYQPFPFASGGADTALSINTTNTVRISKRYTTTLQLPVSSFARLNLALGGDQWRTKGMTLFASPVALTSFLQSPDVSRDQPLKNSGIFAQGQLAFHDELFFTYGIRTDWNPAFGDRARVLPGRYGMSFTHDIETPLGIVSTKLRGSYGRSIRPPRDQRKFATPAAPGNVGSSVITQFGAFDLILANPELGPEHQQGGEGGIELYFGSRSSLTITRYNQTVDNLISQVLGVDSVRAIIPGNPSLVCSSTFRDTDGYCFFYQSQYINVGSIRNQGWETHGSGNIGPITVRGTYSWVKSRVIGVTPRYRALLTGTQFQRGRPFDYLPEHTWALGMTYTQKSSTVSLFVNGIGMAYRSFDNLSLLASSSARTSNTRPRMGVPSIYRALGSRYATADLNATHRFNSNMDALIQINNLANYYHNDFSESYAAAGRQTRAGLRLRF